MFDGVQQVGRLRGGWGSPAYQIRSLAIKKEPIMHSRRLPRTISTEKQNKVLVFRQEISVSGIRV